MGGEKEYDRVSVEEAHSVAMGGEESMQKKCGGLAFVAMVEKKSQMQSVEVSSICGHGRQKSQCKSVEALVSVAMEDRNPVQSVEGSLSLWPWAGRGNDVKCGGSAFCIHGKEGH
jgi:hypothetical protein